MMLVLGALALLVTGVADAGAASKKHKHKKAPKPAAVTAPADTQPRQSGTADEKMSRRDKDLAVKNICTNC
jgi:hypothetical protein